MPELVDGLDSKSSALGHVGSSPTAPTAVMGTYSRFPLTIVRGRGCWVWDEKGRRYLDSVAGIATCSLGHSNVALNRALSRQLRKIQHVSNLYQIEEQETLANWLVSNSCADKVFFCNSGAEANEAAIKLARKYGHKVRNIDSPVILSAKNSFHGRTLAAISATGQPKYHNGFEPVVQGFEFFSYNDINSIKKILFELERKHRCVTAIIIEPLQGEGGVRPGDIGFFKELRKICDEYQILLIFDEVQVGIGRSGEWWGYQQLGIEPDVFTVAKGLGGGHAIGALLAKNDADIFEPGDHASTFGGNPFACKAALTVCSEIERKDLLKNVKERGNELSYGLNKLKRNFPKLIAEVRGWGLIQGLVLDEKAEINSLMVSKAAIKNQLLLAGAGEKVLRIVPPLIINSKEVNEIIMRLELSILDLNT